MTATIGPRGPKAPKRKNVDKDSRAYFLSHEAHRLFQRMARKQHVGIGAFLELQAQELARQLLTPEERVEVRREAEEITAQRRAEAEGHGIDA